MCHNMFMIIFYYCVLKSQSLQHKFLRFFAEYSIDITIYYSNRKNRLKNPRPKIKILSSQNGKYFFGRETLIFHYAHKRSIFQKYFGKVKNGHL